MTKAGAQAFAVMLAGTALGVFLVIERRSAFYVVVGLFLALFCGSFVVRIVFGLVQQSKQPSNTSNSRRETEDDR
jgi:hypothetical protein